MAADREVIYALNDLLDIVSELTKLVSEISPGAVKSIDHIDFLIERVERSIKAAKGIT